MCRKRLSSPRCRSELIDSAWVVIVPGQKCIKKIPRNLKLADIRLNHKKWFRTDKENYRPVSILRAILPQFLSDYFFKKINEYMDAKLSKYQYGVRKGYSSQHCLLVIFEKWRATINKVGSSGVLLTDLSKAFDCLSHDILTAMRTVLTIIL